MKVITRSYVVRNREFVIVQNNDGWYCAIEDKYITNGRLNTELNGGQMHSSKDLNECLDGTNRSVEMDYLVDEVGMTQAQALCKVHGIPYNEKFEAIF